MFKARADEFKYLFILVDLVISSFSFLIAFGIRFGLMDMNFEDLSKIDMWSYFFFGLLLALTQVAVYLLLNLYDSNHLLSFFDEISSIFGGVVLTLLLSISILYFLKVNQVSRTIPLLYGVVNLLLVAAGHAFIRQALLQIRSKEQNLRNIFVIGMNQMSEKMARFVEARKIFGLRIKGFILDREANPADFHLENYAVLGSIENLEEMIERDRPYAVIFTGIGESHERLNSIMEYCDKFGVHLLIVPTYSELITKHGLMETYEGIPVITIRDIPSRSGLNRIVKRGFDILFSLLFILVFSPVFLIVGLLVKLTSKGPVFFSQERVGLDHKVFEILKFRTMTVQEKNQSDVVWTTKNDSRITPIGRFLRKYSLDEIPQFFNVLAGQMSVVGPRPERPFFVEKFKNEYKHFMRRHNVKAGLTGWAQINGLRGDTSIEDRVKADIYYIENWSIFLDLKIIFLTPFKGLFSKNAY